VASAEAQYAMTPETRKQIEPSASGRAKMPLVHQGEERVSEVLSDRDP
jgi:hypothetical protein